MLKCSTSLWSADLANLASDIGRVEPYSDRFHIDVADGHYVRTMLFFPDLVKALRPHTSLPFEAHLMTADPLHWIEPFTEAGADIVICPLDSLHDPAAALLAIKDRGAMAGISLSLEQSLDHLDALWIDIDIVTICGTLPGIKGVSMDPSVPDKIRQARQIIENRGLNVEIQVDGGIRRDTVPLIYAAGAHSIVPGSLMFGEEPRKVRAWLASL